MTYSSVHIKRGYDAPGARVTSSAYFALYWVREEDQDERTLALMEIAEPLRTRHASTNSTRSLPFVQVGAKLAVDGNEHDLCAAGLLKARGVPCEGVFISDQGKRCDNIGAFHIDGVWIFRIL